jgi:aminobenzoyl-glutamate utilization protein B
MKAIHLALSLSLAAAPLAAQGPVTNVDRAGVRAADLEDMLEDVTADVESMRKFTQVMVDKIFSFSELGFQEIETSRYVVSILRENGFQVEENVSGMPTAWFARWGSGQPVIAFGSDIDGIPQSSQKPGVAYHAPIVDGAPGHGEGHNSGQAVNVTAALALKRVMEREGIQGTLVLWPGVAEEQLGSKAFFVRDGLMDGIDAVIFTHVSSNLSVSWGRGSGTGLVSVEFTFEGQAAHGAGSPWRGRSALDAVELMNTGWNFRREHLRPLQRSHYVISNGGDQPNVVPPVASVWYFFREMEYPLIKRNYELGVRIAEGAAMMTDTEMSYRILGAAWPRNFNKVIAETTGEHIEAVGLPQWSDADQSLARAVQREMGSDEEGLATDLDGVEGPPDEPRSGGSDDIGDISWNVPTITLRFPSNIPGLPGHHWSSAIAMATPIAHKGATAGAKVLARTALDLFSNPEKVDEAWTYFRDVQTSEEQYQSFLSADDTPATHLNARIMQEFRPQLEPFYFDPERFDTYLEQLGITYPTLRQDATGGGAGNR